MSNTTKTVSGYFGDKQVTKDEFVKQWREQFSQFYSLAENTAEFNELKAMQLRIVELAGNRWDALK